MDSMKGCLDSLSASNALACGILNTDDDIEVTCVPVADGGEGTADALAAGKGNFRKIQTRVTGPLGRKISAPWYMDHSSGTAFIDMASAAGIALIKEEERNPLFTTTYGVGELIMAAVNSGAGRILLGLGGSATVDAGLGACQAMGLRLKDIEGNVLPTPFTGRMLSEVGDFEVSGFLANNHSFELILMCDVSSPFTGQNGASRVFAPQKGASKEVVEVLEAGMEHVRRLILKKTEINLNLSAGSGAAGGSAGGLMTFAGGKIMKGAPLLLDAIGFDKIIEDSDLVVTGEGSSDSQTLMGKIPFEILQRGLRKGIPVVLASGRISDKENLLAAGFADAICINNDEYIKLSDTMGEDALNAEVAEKRLKAAGRKIP